jgi:hypothetical protein
MGRPIVNTTLASIAALTVSAVLIATTALALETYKARDLVQARYGPRESEFGFKDYDGEYLGALFFAVASGGAIYVYDGIKGDIKVFGNSGAFAKTIKAEAWQVGDLFPADMTLTSNGDIYVLYETSDPQDCYKVFLTAAGIDTVRSVPVADPSSFCHSGDDGRIYGAAGIVSDEHGNVYLADWRTWKSRKLTSRGRVLPDSAQSSSLREGVPVSTGGFMSYCPRGSRSQKICGLVLRDEAGKLVRDWSKLQGVPVGIDKLGNVYLGMFMISEHPAYTKIIKYSPDGSLLAVIDIPMSGGITNQYGKHWIVGTDGSIYEMIGTRESVRVRKWERVR